MYRLELDVRKIGESCEVGVSFITHDVFRLPTLVKFLDISGNRRLGIAKITIPDGPESIFGQLR